jgi:hypothetical protein
VSLKKIEIFKLAICDKFGNVEDFRKIKKAEIGYIERKDSGGFLCPFVDIHGFPVGEWEEAKLTPSDHRTASRAVVR